jgi:hypothetical protein
MRAPALVLAALLTAAAAPAQEVRPLAFDAGWELSGPGTRVETWSGASALRMRNGGALRRDISLQDGTIEFDLSVSGQRSFVYLRFRWAGEDEGEEIYFRPHKSSLPDAIQYAPVWRGEANWQLYHGAWGTAPATFPRNEWVHVRVVLEGRRLAVFLGHAERPAMVLPLAREPAPGPIGFYTFTPPTSDSGGDPVAAVANVVVRPGVVSHRFEPEAEPGLPVGLVRRWQLSAPFPVDSVPLVRLPETLLAGRRRWPAYDVEPHGVLVLGRHLERPAPASGSVARLVLRAERDGLHRLELGFSDYVTVFLGGRPLFAGDAHYSYDRPRQEGLIGLSQAVLWLPLAKGDNEVLLAVSDGFGGWGLTARLDPGSGARMVLPEP